MGAANTVEATLRSKFEDGVSKGVEHTEKLMAQAFSSMRNGGAALTSFMDGVWNSVTQGLSSWCQRLKQASDESDSDFRKMGMAGAAMAAGLVLALAKAAKAVVGFVFNLAKESSQALEVRNAFDSLTQSMDIQADLLLGKLKRATEGQISGTVLMQNANRVLQSNVPITSDVYAKLTENVFRLAKASGADGTQAVQTLTDAIVRGNARGLQAIGIHVAVKDAVTAMAEAQGVSAGRLGDESKLRTYYNELLLKTDQAVAGLGTQFVTIEDILKQSQVTWSGFLSSIGQAIGRSGTLQGLLEKLNKEMLATSMSKSQLDEFTLATNRFVVSFLTGVSNVVIVLGSTITVVEVFWATVKVAFNVGAGAVILVVLALQETLTQFVELLARIPGAAKLGLTGLATSMRSSAELLKNSLVASAQGAIHAFDGIGETEAKLDQFGYAVARTAGELTGMEGTILRGTAGLNQHGTAAANAAEQLKKINEQQQKYAELWKELAGRSGNPQASAQAQLFGDFAKIDQELTLTGIEWDQKRNTLKLQALENYYAKLRELETKAADEENKQAEEKARLDAAIAGQQINYAQAVAVLDMATGADRIKVEKDYQAFLEKCAAEREEQRQKDVSQALASANTILRTIELASQGRISPQSGQDALNRLPQTIDTLEAKLKELRSHPILTDEQLDEVTRLQTKLDQLNRLKMTPFQKAIESMRQAVSQFTRTATESFATFFSNLVTGTEGAGQKLLAAFIGMIGQMLVHIGTILVESGIAEIALAQTLVGRMMGASVAAGIKAIAVGALLAAAGGVMEGAASNLSDTSSSSSSVASASSSSSSSNDVKVIEVGAPRGPQNPGEASAAQEPIQVHLKIDAEDGFVVRQVERNVKNNGRLRTVIQNA